MILECEQPTALNLTYIKHGGNRNLNSSCSDTLTQKKQTAILRCIVGVDINTLKMAGNGNYQTIGKGHAFALTLNNFHIRKVNLKIWC